MKSEKLDRRPIVAAILASLLLLIFGLAHLVPATIIATPVTTVPIASDVLDGFPLQIGDWTGIDVPLDKSIVSNTDADAVINRRYSRANGLESVSLYICCGVKTRRLMIHRPEVCYPGNGWTPINRRSAELSLDGGVKLPHSIYQYSRGDLNREDVTILHYFIADGQYHDSVSVLRQRLWRLFSSVPWVAQVQIVAPSRGTITADEKINKIVSEFAVDSAPSIAEIFESIQKDQSAKTTDPLKKGDSL